MKIVLVLVMLLAPLTSSATVADASAAPGIMALYDNQSGVIAQFEGQGGGGAGAASVDPELVGLWRTTRIVFDSPRDDFLELRPDGTAVEWSGTAHGQGAKTTGRWAVTGREISIIWSDGTRSSRPFTMYEGQLVLPNIQGSRIFWDRIRVR